MDSSVSRIPIPDNGDSSLSDVKKFVDEREEIYKLTTITKSMPVPHHGVEAPWSVDVLEFGA